MCGETVLFYIPIGVCVQQYPDHTPKFDVYVNNDWQRRHTSLQRFVQAGRQAIIRQRCQKRLKRLKSGVNGKEHGQPVAEMSGRQKEPSVTAALPVAAEHILPCSLPKYIEHKKTVSSWADDNIVMASRICLTLCTQVATIVVMTVFLQLRKCIWRF